MICRTSLSGSAFRRGCCRVIQSGKGNQPTTFPISRLSTHAELIQNPLLPDMQVQGVKDTIDTSNIDVLLEDMKTTTSFTSRHNELIRAIQHIPRVALDLKKKALVDVDTYGYDALVAAEKGGLFVRQLLMEEEQQSDAVTAYTESLKELINMGRGTGLKYVQRILLKWYEPFTQEIADEIRLIEDRVAGQDRTQYGPSMLLLPAEKLAVIVLDEALNSILKTANSGVQLTHLAKRIGELVEAEVSIIKLQKGKAGLRPWQQDILKEAYSQPSFRRTRVKLNRLVEEESWPNELKVKLGASLLSFLIDSATTESNLPAFIHTKKIMGKDKFKKVGILQLDEGQYNEIARKDMRNVQPRFLPMLVPPKCWDNKRMKDGCYFRLRSTIMRTTSRSQQDCLRKAEMPAIIDGLNYLGQIPWRINTTLLTILTEASNRKLPLGDLPSLDIPQPKEEDCVRIIPPRKKYKDFQSKEVTPDINDPSDINNDPHPTSIHIPDDSIISDPNRVNMSHLEFNRLAVASSPFGDISSMIVDHNKNIQNSTLDLLNPKPKVPENDPVIPQFDERYYNEMCRRVNLKNSEMHSLRCDLSLKFWVAEKFKGETFYFPHNLDFRGRAYPVPPNLNHLGSDMCRAMLLFDKAKPLGPTGLFWMKVHLANLFGNNKIPHHERAAFVDDNIELIRDCVTNPLDGKKFWNTADEPFQALAVCIELVTAIDSDNHEEFQSRMPVHQDGSCNGLQHYAALGKDEVGALAVNVRPSDRPQDVYTSVLNIVKKKIALDVDIPDNDIDEIRRLRGVYARRVQGVVNRKVIKQTVMTSVYGVTKIGARAQVQARLEETLITDASMVITPEMEKELFGSASYVANLTLESLQEMFIGANLIMDWLGTCASLVAGEGQVMTWITPLGLPVMQPYRKVATHTVRTILQSITLSLDDDALPVSRQKQRSAFPPNFVHSLDATHMLMTTLKMKEKEITFAAVHDSYWTHAADIPVMNEAIRECFIDLYEQPILEKLHESLMMRYPDVEFPSVPKRGDLDLKSVKESAYFFH